MHRTVALAFLLLTGCVTVTLQRKPLVEDEIEVSPPGEDGSRYVAVRSGRRTQPAMLKRKWANVATKACEGDYILMTDGMSEQRTAGIVSARTHEGFVRCLMPSQAEATEQLDTHADKSKSKS